MAWLHLAWSKVIALVSRDHHDREFDEELTTHFELLVDEGCRNGLSPAEARRQAFLRLGSPIGLREDNREQRGIPTLEVLAQDLRYAIRMLRKTPAVTIVITVSLALGLGANFALFSLMDALLLRSLPVRDADRLVQVHLVPPGPFNKPIAIFPKSTFDDLSAPNPVFSEVVGFNQLDRAAVTIRGEAEPPRHVDQVTTNFFRDLGVTPILGRAPAPDDAAVSVLSYRVWQERFGGSPEVLGQTLSVNGQSFSIIGVAPPRFLGLSVERSTALWITLPSNAGRQLIGRFKNDVTPERASAGLRSFFPRQPNEPLLQVVLPPVGKGISQLRAPYQRPLLALNALVTVVLLMTCMNVGSLLMVRNTARRRELTMRVALGARRSRRILQYLVESAVLAVLGSILALVVARWGVDVLLSMLPLPAAPESLAFQINARTLGFAAAISMVSALLFGIAPAWRASQVEMTDLKASTGNTPTRTTRRLGRSLVACQVALSVLLLVGAGLFGRTLLNLTARDTGVQPESLVQVLMDARGSGYRQNEMVGLGRLIVDRLAVIPGVSAVTHMRNPIMRGGMAICGMPIPGVTREREDVWPCTDVGPGFFETMRIPVVRGRTFTADDFAQGRRLATVSEAFAKRFFPGEDPIGKRIGDQRYSTEIVGVVRDVKLAAARRDPGPMSYFMVPGDPDRFDVVQVRIAGDPDAIGTAIANEIRRVNPRLLIEVVPVPALIDRSLATERMVATTSTFFSTLGLLLVSIGIFGIASYTVAQRTNEIGIRMTLGAGRWSVIRDALRDTMRVFGIGLVLGVVFAIATVRLTTGLIADLLFGITATDTLNIAGAVMVMVIVAVTACVLPARRATRIDPLMAIRYE